MLGKLSSKILNNPCLKKVKIISIELCVLKMTSPMPTWRAFYKYHNGRYSDKLREIDMVCAWVWAWVHHRSSLHFSFHITLKGFPWFFKVLNLYYLNHTFVLKFLYNIQREALLYKVPKMMIPLHILMRCH